MRKIEIFILKHPIEFIFGVCPLFVLLLTIVTILIASIPNRVTSMSTWYDVTIMIHYPDKPKEMRIRCANRPPKVHLRRGYNYIKYSDKTGVHCIGNIAPIEITDIKQLR